MKQIKRHLGSLNASPIDIPENSFETENDISFDILKLDVHCQEKDIIFKAVVKILKKISDLSNANLIKNADGLLSKKKRTVPKLSGLVRQRKGFYRTIMKYLIEFYFSFL